MTQMYKALQSKHQRIWIRKKGINSLGPFRGF